ncbi:vomeronasal type-2 receptor 26-like [Leptodactylus fuscus]|uniref:vomeronasal type-2 receptor 26-like n=1 Tax=Leptodactylus fuscus TaxID=238119 RepID=UPI003F4EFD31
MAVTELLEHFGWTWVGILVADDDAGEKELQILRKYMRERGICVAYTAKYTDQRYNIEYNQILQVLHNPQVRVIILCGTFTYMLVHMIENLGFVFLDKTFILPPSMAFSSVSSYNWFPDFNRSLVVDFSSQSFQGMEDFLKSYKKLPNIFNEESYWEDLDSMTKEALRERTRKIKGSKVLPSKALPKLVMRDHRSIPVSRCSEPCLPGSRKKPRETIHTCCYDCVPCSEGEIANITDADSCSKCQSDEWSNEKRDRCLPKVMEFISYHNDTIASVSSCASVCGCLVTGSIFGIFISYRDIPIVKANNRNLSYLLLVSIILSFLSVFLFLGRPSDVTCRLRETSFGVFFSVAVSSLLAKTVMVCVAFKSIKPGSPWRKWLSVKLPYTIVLLCSSFQVVICVLWLSISPPFQDLDTQSYPEKIIIQCNEGSDLWFYSMLGYMGLLAAVSFLLAFMVRTLPDSFNEAKYITFSMLLFCSVWMAMIPAYLSTRGKYMVAVEIFAVMASSAGLLACVFFPKCFIILFRSDMNRKTDLLGRRKEICNNSNK